METFSGDAGAGEGHAAKSVDHGDVTTTFQRMNTILDRSHMKMHTSERATEPHTRTRALKRVTVDRKGCGGRVKEGFGHHRVLVSEVEGKRPEEISTALLRMTIG